MAILVNAETRVLIQGITGREATIFTSESLQYGTRIVAGVTPGRGGLQVHNVPVYDTVRQALKAHDCDATVISVPPRFVRDAASEALDNGITILVIITERVPRSDVVAIVERAAMYDARVLGPNSLGIISPGHTRVGMCGGSVEATRQAYTSGSVGIMSRSGGMMTEIANMLTQANIGQSTCISIGGDPIVGSTFIDLLPFYEADSETKALVLFCEPGGTMEEQLADYLRAHANQLHIVAFIAGRFTDRIQGVRFGHAGAIVEGDYGSPAGKNMALEDSGVLVADKLSQIPHLLQEGFESGA